jgi:hypothetical protein
MGNNAKSNKQCDGKRILDCVGRFRNPESHKMGIAETRSAFPKHPGLSVAAGWLKAVDRWVNFNEIPKRERLGALRLQR